MSRTAATPANLRLAPPGYHGAMATTSTRRTPPKPRRATPAKPKRPVNRPFLRFYHSQDLRKKTLSQLKALETAQDPTAHRGALSDLVIELNRAGLDYYFMGPLKLAKAGFIVEQSASLGMAGVQQVMGSVVRNIIGRMDKAQLISVSGSIRQLML